jgi:hypothetical protein
MTMTIWNAVSLFMFLLIAAPAGAETESEAAHREIVKKDLFAVITLNGTQCEEVVDFEIQEETLYIATCKNGKRFRIYVTDDGRVEVGSHEG